MSQDSQLVARVDRIEAKVDAIAAGLDRIQTLLLQQGGHVVATVVDIADAAVADAADRGVDVDAHLRAGGNLAVKVTEPDTAARIERLLAKLEQLEPAIEAAPGLLAMGVDIADEAATQAAEQGVDLSARAGAAMRLLSAMSTPERLAQFERLGSQLDNLEPALAGLSAAPGLIATVLDILDEAAAQATKQGVDLDRALRATANLTLRLGQPDVLGAVERLTAHAGALGTIAELLDGLPNGLAMGVDIFDDLARAAAARGADFETILRVTTDALQRLSTFITSPAFQSLLDSGVLDTEAIALVGEVGRVAAEARTAPSESVGVFALLRAMKEPEVQRAISFGLRIARGFGHALEQGQQPARLPAGR